MLTFVNCLVLASPFPSLPDDQELRGVEGLMLSFSVRWPLSLVLSKKSLTKYQLLFRHLFFAKHVQRLLSKNSWREHQVGGGGRVVLWRTDGETWWWSSDAYLVVVVWRLLVAFGPYVCMSCLLCWPINI